MGDSEFLRMNRRRFLQTSGSAGLLFYFSLNPIIAWAAEAEKKAEPPPWMRKPPEDFNAYLRIAADGKVTCCTGKVEMGQGAYTSLQQMLAEELEVSLDSVDIIMGDTALCPWDMGTFGSMTTRFFGPPLRKAGATARQVLLEMAAEKLRVPIDKLVIANGVIYNSTDRSQKVSYGDLAQGKRIERRPKGAVHLKQAHQFKVMGEGAARKDGPEKVTGAAKYAADIMVPGMLYAKILRPPAHGVQLVEADTTAAAKTPGVKVVREGDFIAVLHERPDLAQAALAKVVAKFSDSKLATDEETNFDYLMQHSPPAKVIEEGGNLQAASTGAVEHTYFNDYVAHAAIEPHAALVKIDNGEVTVWVSSQTPFMAQEEVAKELGLPTNKVRVLPIFLGGGFGGKSYNQQAVEAARCARLTGKPVQVAWSREEEFFYDTFRPAAVVKVKSALGKKGEISLWDYQVFFAGEPGAELFYKIPNYRVQRYGSLFEGGVHRATAHPFAVGPWRAPGANTNAHARESEIDILAEKAKADPVEFRLRHLANQRHQNVLKTAAAKFGWKKHIGASRKGVGVACCLEVGTFVAMMAEVDVDRRSGNIQVERVVCVQDMGMVVNPRGAKVQMEGSVTMGLGYALREMMHFKNGRILDTNFGSYEIPHFTWLPKIETYLIENQTAEAQGGGEPSIVNVGAVIANAVYDAIGVRLFRLPMTSDRVLAALKH